jgi:pilus assembly protein CpaB
VGRRRRALVLLSLALACGGVAASQVGGRLREVEARVGPPARAVVARSDLEAGERLSRRLLAVRSVPARFLPPDALGSADEAAGLRLAVPVAAGSYLTTGSLAAGGDKRGSGAALAPGDRAVDVAVAGGQSLSELAEPGARVDVLVTARGRTYLALQDAELLGVRSSNEAEGAATTVATLRVSLREAVYLTAAQSFAREVRLLVRPPRERRHVRAPVVSGAGL